MKVMKFGGGCLRDDEHFLKVARVINSEQDKAVIVVSAVSGITDMLEEGIQISMESEKNVAKIIRALEEKHKNIILSIMQKDDIQQNIIKEIEARMKGLERLLHGVAYTGEITESVRALILSYGERLSALTLTGVLKGFGRDAVAMEADQIGLITDESFENATASLEEARKNLVQTVLPVVNKGSVPVITGYFGCTNKGKITTFGRNGTDYSAAVISHGINADHLEIWKDVDGFMSSDPKIIKGASRIDALSYYEAAELSYFGARILHPRTVESLVEENIPLYIKNLYEPENRGTKVSRRSDESKNVVKSVTFNKQISVLKIHGPGVGFKPGIIAEIGRVLSENGINIYSVITSQTCINLLVDEKDSQRSYGSIKKMAGGVIERVDLENNIALIAVVGEGLLKKKGLAARVFSAVAEQGINIEMISSGASEVAYYFIVKEDHMEEAIKAVHREFFEKA